MGAKCSKEEEARLLLAERLLVPTVRARGALQPRVDEEVAAGVGGTATQELSLALRKYQNQLFMELTHIHARLGQ